MTLRKWLRFQPYTTLRNLNSFTFCGLWQYSSAHCRNVLDGACASRSPSSYRAADEHAAAFDKAILVYSFSSRAGISVSSPGSFTQGGSPTSARRCILAFVEARSSSEALRLVCVPPDGWGCDDLFLVRAPWRGLHITNNENRRSVWFGNKRHADVEEEVGHSHVLISLARCVPSPDLVGSLASNEERGGPGGLLQEETVESFALVQVEGETVCQLVQGENNDVLTIFVEMRIMGNRSGVTLDFDICLIWRELWRF